MIGKSQLIFVLTLLLCAFTVTAHETGEAHEEDGYYQTFSQVLPFMYFAQGAYLTGTLVIVFWIGIIYGLYNLYAMLLGSALRNHDTIRKKK